ncbi:MAG: DUF1499 domain-containing protein [Rhodocyclaceae bacterium]|nr:DUF1499 domain-containing protein [Rhodocyclaceae bacterium]
MNKILKVSLLITLSTILAIAAVIAINAIGDHHKGRFSGKRPTDLGYTNGKFKPMPRSPNAVSSTTAKDDKHYIEPLKFDGSADVAWKRLNEIVSGQKGATVVSTNAGYTYAEFKTPLMGYIDDVEFALDAGASVIHVRSASRLGESDLGLNRKRVEAIRTAFGQK